MENSKLSCRKGLVNIGIFIFIALIGLLVFLPSTVYTYQNYNDVAANVIGSDTHTNNELENQSTLYASEGGVKGACIYGPPGLKACVNGTYKKECEENFKGQWLQGQRCP